MRSMGDVDYAIILIEGGVSISGIDLVLGVGGRISVYVHLTPTGYVILTGSKGSVLSTLQTTSGSGYNRYQLWIISLCMEENCINDRIY